MSFTFMLECHIAAKAERVFAALADLEGAKEWMQDLVSLRKTTEGPFGVGTQWEETRRMFGKNDTEYFEVTHYEPPASMSVFVDGSKGSTGKGRYLFHYEVTPDGEGSRVTLASELDIPGVFTRAFGWLFIGSFKRAMKKDLHAMKEHVEAQSG